METKNIKIIIGYIADMLINNSDYGINGIAESFIDWCENGNVFWSDDRLKTDKNRQECIKLMYRISPFVSNLSTEIYKIYEEFEED